jgi:hypothetical protein
LPKLSNIPRVATGRRDLVSERKIDFQYWYQLRNIHSHIYDDISRPIFD